MVEDCSDDSDDSGYDSDIYTYEEEESDGDNVLENLDPSTATANVIPTW